VSDYKQVINATRWSNAIKLFSSSPSEWPNEVGSYPSIAPNSTSLNRHSTGFHTYQTSLKKLAQDKRIFVSTIATVEITNSGRCENRHL